MIVELTLSVSSNDLYDLIIHSLINDIQKSKPKFKKEDLHQGFSYNKNLKGKVNQKALTTVKIEKLVTPKIYAASIHSANGVTSLSYTLEQDGDLTHVVYDERFKSEKKIMNLNYKIVSKFYEKKSRKRIVHMLRQMEAYIQQSKEGK